MLTSFALLRLPHNDTKVVFGELCESDFDSIVCFSTCSTKSKSLVKNMRLKIDQMEVDLRDGFSIYFFPKAKYFVVNPTDLTDLEMLTPSQLFLPGSSIVLCKPSMRHSLDHFRYIFNQKAIDLRFGPSDRWMYSLESICKSLRGLSVRSLIVSYVAEESIIFDILRCFPLAIELYIFEHSDVLKPDVSKANINQLQKIFIENMTFISLRHNIPIILDTLLIMNHIEISLSKPRLCDKEIRFFLKLWKRGSNPRLEKLSCMWPQQIGMLQNRQFDENFILKGIPYKVQPHRRWFKSNCCNTTEPRSVEGGYDIKRYNGDLATVTFKRNNFNMFVWSPNNTYNADDNIS